MNGKLQRQLIAREYRRLSDAKGGSSLTRQGSENSAAAVEQGWCLGAPYVDDGKSASRYARKSRDDFELLMSDLTDGTFGADVLMLWESSRGSRRVGEWVTFIELCEAKGVRIWVTTHERLYDPANGRDRKSLLEDAISSEYESYLTHRRVSGTAALEATGGRPYGKAPDGMMPVYNPKTGKLVTWVEDPERSQIPKELFRLLEAGHSLAAIERTFLEAGYLNLSGAPFSREHLRDMAMRHAYAGVRLYKGTVYEGTWDGIVARERFWTVYGIVTDPARRSTRAGKGLHEITETIRCGPCGGPMRFGRRKGRTDCYRCRLHGCVAICADGVDEVILGSEEHPGALLAYLAREDIFELLAAPGSDDESVVKLRADLAAARANKRLMDQTIARTVHEMQVIARSTEALASEIAEMEAREREFTTPAAVLAMIRPGVPVWQSWREAPMSARREVARIVLSPAYLGRVHIQPAPNSGPAGAPAVERIEWHRATAGTGLVAAG